MFELPEEARESTAALRLVVSEQVDALKELSNLVTTRGNPRDTSSPRDALRTAARPAQPRAMIEQDIARSMEDVRQAVAPTLREKPSVSQPVPAEPVADQGPSGGWISDLLRRAKLTARHTISREELSVREHMSSILRHLQSAKFVEFHELFDPSRGVPVIVVNFIALLELSKESLIEITQAEAFAPIYVRLSYSPN